MDSSPRPFVIALAAFLLVALGLLLGLTLYGLAFSSPASPPSAVHPPGDPRPAADPASRAEPSTLTAEQVRRIVAEELARARQGPTDGQAEPSAPEEAPRAPRPTPRLQPPLEPTRLEAVKTTLLDMRRHFIEYDLQYNLGPNNALERPDPSRLERFPDERVWPSQPLGWIEQDPKKYRLVDSAGEGFDPTTGKGAFVFTTPLDRPLATQHYTTLVFERGVASSGVLTLQSYGTILCKGDMGGKLHLDSYATVVIDGNLTGSIVSTSYATILVLGSMSGSFESKSYANLRVMKGFAGKMTLYDSNSVYLGGHTSSSALESIECKGRASITLESSDLPSGEHAGKGSLKIRVL